MCRNPIVRLATIDDAQVISELILPLATTFIAHEFLEAGQRNLLRSMEPDAIERFHQHSVIADKGAVAFYEKCGFEQSVCTAMWIYGGNDH